MRLAEFLRSPTAVRGQLEEAHVVALVSANRYHLCCTIQV